MSDANGIRETVSEDSVRQAARVFPIHQRPAFDLKGVRKARLFGMDSFLPCAVLFVSGFKQARKSGVLPLPEPEKYTVMAVVLGTPERRNRHNKCERLGENISGQA
jgi:hypothetical protein